jgi:hypothetical protein
VDSVKNEGQIYVFPVAKIAAAGKILMVCVAVTILLIPVFFLYLIAMSSIITLIMIMAFVFVFATVMSLSGAKVENVFIGTCTYVYLIL